MIYLILILSLLFTPNAFAQTWRVTSPSQHPYRHTPNDLNSGTDNASDEECVTYESSTGLFEWQTCGSGSSTTITGKNQGTTVVSDVTSINAVTGLVATLNGANQWDVYLDLPVSTATALNANGTNCGAGNYARGVDASGNAEDCTAAAGGGDALTTNPLSQFASTTSAQLAGVITDETGTGQLVYNTNAEMTGLTVKTLLTADNIIDSGLTASRFVTTDGSKTLTNSGTSSALASTITDESGTGQAVFNTTPSITDLTTLISLKIPTGTAPTVDEAGELAEDTTDRGQLAFMSGLTVGIVTRTQEKCLTIENLAAADDNMELGSFPYPVTIEKIWCYCRGTCTTLPTFTFEDAATNAMTLIGTPTCATTTDNAVPADVSAGGALIAYEKWQFDVTNTPDPATDEYMLCYEFSKTRQ